MGRRGFTIRVAACALVGALAGASILAGCEKTQARKAIVLNPTTRQAAQVAVAITPSLTTQPAATQAATKHCQHQRVLGRPHLAVPGVAPRRAA